MMSVCRRPTGGGALLQNLLLWWNLTRNLFRLRFFLWSLRLLRSPARKGCQAPPIWCGAIYAVSKGAAVISGRVLVRGIWSPPSLRWPPRVSREYEGAMRYWDPGRLITARVARPQLRPLQRARADRRPASRWAVCYTALLCCRDCASALRAAATPCNADPGATRCRPLRRAPRRFAVIDFGQGRRANGCEIRVRQRAAARRQPENTGQR
jgi:hypothetical protein